MGTNYHNHDSKTNYISHRNYEQEEKNIVQLTQKYVNFHVSNRPRNMVNESIPKMTRCLYKI